jgi:hypothetical protein
MRNAGFIGFVLLAASASFGVSLAVGQEATPIADGAVMTFTLVERALNVSIIDVGESGPSAGDLTVWGPDPLYDAANEVDTGALTQGSCLALNAEGDNHCTETIVFADSSTLAIQGVQLGGGGPSLTTIVGGSGIYLEAHGTLTVTASDDFLLWTKTFEITIE